MSDMRVELDELKREVRALSTLRDRQEILDCINAYCRALDRLDVELLRGCYHSDAIDRHGPFIGGREEFVPWAIDLIRGFPSTHHSVTSHTCELDGDVAHAETYCLFFVITPDGKGLGAGAARYIDRFERKNGRWAIAARCEVMDYGWELARSGWLGAAWEEVPALRDRTDLSYQRPLQVPRPALE